MASWILPKNKRWGNFQYINQVLNQDCLISHTVHSMSAKGTSALNCMHECLRKTLSQDCPHREVAFSTSMCIYNVNHKPNLKPKKTRQIAVCDNLL